MVIGPTPPGTGEIAPATSATSANATSPTMRERPPAGVTRLTPTSMTVAPGLTQSRRTISGRPTAANKRSARRDLVQSGLHSLVIWALSDNEPAVGFYRALGGKAVARSSERFGTRTLDKVAFAWAK